MTIVRPIHGAIWLASSLGAHSPPESCHGRGFLTESAHPSNHSMAGRLHSRAIGPSTPNSPPGAGDADPAALAAPRVQAIPPTPQRQPSGQSSGPRSSAHPRPTVSRVPLVSPSRRTERASGTHWLRPGNRTARSDQRMPRQMRARLHAEQMAVSKRISSLFESVRKSERTVLNRFPY